MIGYFCFFLQVLGATTASAQCAEVFNTIFTIDEELAIISIRDFSIVDQTGKVYACGYYPGRLIVLDCDEKIDSLSNPSLRLEFLFEEYEGKNLVSKAYTLDMPIYYLKQEFLVINIYNLDKKRYRRRFDALDSDRNYTFELAWSGGEMLRHKK